LGKLTVNTTAQRLQRGKMAKKENAFKNHFAATTAFSQRRPFHPNFGRVLPNQRRFDQTVLSEDTLRLRNFALYFCKCSCCMSEALITPNLGAVEHTLLCLAARVSPHLAGTDTKERFRRNGQFGKTARTLFMSLPSASVRNQAG